MDEEEGRMSSKRKRLMVNCLLCSRRRCHLKENDDDDPVDSENPFLSEMDNYGEADSVKSSERSEACTLKKQEAKMFVLRQILEIPQRWCESKRLGRATWKRGRGYTKSNNALIQICDDCLTTGVLKAWQICQQMKELEKSFAEMKGEIRETMKERADRNKSNRKEGRKSNVVETMHDEVVKLTFEKSAEWEAPTTTPNLTDDQPAVSTVQDDLEKNFITELEDGSINLCDDGDNDGLFEPDLLNVNSDDNDNDSNLKIDKIDPDWAAVFPVTKVRKKKKVRMFLYCTRCKTRTRFATEERLSDHMKIHEENDALGDAAFNCVHCAFPCQSSVELDIHVHKRHIIPSRLRTYSCTQCPFQTKSWRDLKRHVGARHPTATEEELGPDFTLTCTKCDIRFTTPQAFNYHDKLVHPSPEEDPTEGESAEPVQCPDCGILFESQAKLRFHFYSIHKRECHYVCEQCGKGFSQKRHLANHKTTHEPHLRLFICHLCGADYNYQFTLDDHYKKHHPNESRSSTDGNPVPPEDEQVHKCRYCDLTSPYKVVLHRHLQTHKREMGHECDKCGKFYVSPQGLKRHHIINHPENTDRKFRCIYCYKAFPSQNSVENHTKKHCSIKRLKDRQKFKQNMQESEEKLELELVQDDYSEYSVGT